MSQPQLPLPTNRTFSGLYGAVARPAPLGTNELGRTRQACGLGTDDALPRAGRVAGVHPPRPGWSPGTLKHAQRVMGATRGLR
jgi:hypothetical protein